MSITADNLTVAQLVAYFESHCECRPTDVGRNSHSHDCDTDCCQDVWLALCGQPNGCDFRSYREVIAQARRARERIADDLNSVAQREDMDTIGGSNSRNYVRDDK